jgi:hypothetical protein
VTQAISYEDRQLWRALVAASPSGVFTALDADAAGRALGIQRGTLEALWRLRDHGLLVIMANGRETSDSDYRFLLPYADDFPQIVIVTKPGRGLLTGGGW